MSGVTVVDISYITYIFDKITYPNTLYEYINVTFVAATKPAKSFSGKAIETAIAYRTASNIDNLLDRDIDKEKALAAKGFRWILRFRGQDRPVRNFKELQFIVNQLSFCRILVRILFPVGAGAKNGSGCP